MAASKVNLPAGAPTTVVSLSFYANAYNGWLRLGLYSDNGSGTAPVNRLCQSPPSYLNTTGWVTLDVPDTIITPGNYWIAVSTDQTVSLIYATGAAGDSVVDSTATYGSMPSVYTVNGSFIGNYNYSTHANYCQ